MNAGLNLFSIRSLIQTEEDFLSTALKLKEQGYSYLQYSGAPFDAERIARVSKASGLPVLLTHAPMDRILGDAEKLMDEHEVFGCKNIGLGMMPWETARDESACKQFVEQLDRVGEKMQKRGFSLFYHNHHWEFFRHGNETVLAYMARTAKHINFTLDSYWVQFGGADLLATIEQLKGRIACVHLKDYAIFFKEDGMPEPRFAPVGEGNIDFKKVVPAMQAAGAKYFFVEQDNAADLPDPLGEVKKSIEYIKKEL